MEEAMKVTLEEANKNNQEVTVENQENNVVEQLFKIRGNEERNKFVITVGNHLATKKTFETQEEAEEYISEPKWETVFALITEMLTIQDKEVKEMVIEEIAETLNLNKES